MKVLKNLNSLDQDQANRMEKEQRRDFKNEIGAERQEQQKAIEKKKAEETMNRKNSKFVKQGRTVMVRSMKPTIKKQEVKQTIDQDTLDNLKYLGDLDDLVA